MRGNLKFFRSESGSGSGSGNGSGSGSGSGSGGGSGSGSGSGCLRPSEPPHPVKNRLFKKDYFST